MIRTKWLIVTSVILGLLNSANGGPPASNHAGTEADPIPDSAMTTDEAFEGLDPKCPRDIRNQQVVIPVRYWGFDKKVHQGQLVADKDVEKDIVEVFEIAFQTRFPFQSVIPISHPKFRKDRVWSDDLSMAANNTSSFNYRLVTGGMTLSNHATGRAIDINTVQNPYFKGDVVLPPGAKYDPEAEGTLTADHPVTKAFLARGWSWGGNWKSPKDYQHFEKPVPVSPEWVKPPALKPGDTIAFVAPAGPVDINPVREYARQLENAGYKVQVPEGVARRNRYLAGTDDERVEELNAALRDPKVRAIFAIRGGYGLTRILDRVDYSALRRDPKIVTGYSDLTALHLAIAREAQVVSFHSPMPMSSLWRDGDEFTYAAASFRRAVFADQYAKGVAGYPVAAPADAPGPVKLVGGKTQGRLIGGNLTLICATLGTPYAIRPKGAILFIEDVGEAPYRIDRCLSQLRLAGVLDDVAGVVVGQFTSDKPNDGPDAQVVLREYFGALKVPVVMNFPVGHVSRNATLPHGALAELDADKPSLRLIENPVRAD